MSEIARMGRISVDTDIAKLSYRVIEVNGKPVAIVEFELKKPISPEEAADIAKLLRAFVAEFVRPNVPENTDLYAISGRGPIWLYGLILHHLMHNVPVLGVFDPKIGKNGGIVIVAVHSYGAAYNEGQVVELPAREAAKLSQ